MEMFVNHLDKEKFKSTNELWNSLKLNSKWSIGYVTALIESKPFTSKEEWMEHYYLSGQERKQGMQELNEDMREVLNRFRSYRYSLPDPIKDWNFQFGRTKEELLERALVLHQKLVEDKNPLGITLEECHEMVIFRVICETWNGIVIRERNTHKVLSNLFPKADIRKTPPQMDYDFAVDLEVYDGGKLICGIQVKPKSFMLANAQAKLINDFKNKQYGKSSGVDVIYVYASSRGEIENKESLAYLRELLHVS